MKRKLKWQQLDEEGPSNAYPPDLQLYRDEV